MPKPPTAHPCPGFTRTGEQCKNTTTKPWCGRCAGLTPPVAGSTAGIGSAADSDARDGAVFTEAAASIVPDDRPVTDIARSMLDDVTRLVNERSAGGSFQRVAASENAILTRHPDNYGAALTEYGWGTAEAGSDRGQVLDWLVNDADGDTAGVYQALQTLFPDAEPENKAAAARFDALLDPADPTRAGRLTEMVGAVDGAAGSGDPS